jgi:hypothetical protein
MKKVANKAKQKARATRGTGTEHTVNRKPLSAAVTWAISAVLVALSIGFGLSYVFSMKEYLGVFGFPFDQAWVPLSYARNLVEHGAYSAYYNVMVSSGSTSPLYVFLLAGFRLVTESEFLPPFIIGIASSAASAVFLFLTARKIFEDDQWIAVAVAVAFVCFPQIHSSAVSGLSTMLYVSLISGSMYAYFARRTLPFFILAGLALWVRPDALIFMIAALLHIAYTHSFAAKSETMDDATRVAAKKSARLGGMIYLVLIAGYFLFNLAMGGSLFPNTVAAKIAYYSLGESDFMAEVGNFVSGGPSAVLLIFTLIGMLLLVVKIVRRQSMVVILPFAYIVTTLFAFGLIHPYLYEGGRYLIPSLPFFLLLGAWGIGELFRAISSSFPVKGIPAFGRMILFLVFAGTIIAGILGFGSMRESHYTATSYTQTRNVQAAQWLDENTLQSTIIGTHLPGAAAYYGKRELVDFSGVLSPELIPTIGKLSEVYDALVAHNVDYILANRDQFEVVNVNPEFTTDIKFPGITEIIPFIPQRTYIVAQRASRFNATAEMLLAQRRTDEASQFLQESFNLERKSCRTNLLIAYSFLDKKDTSSASEFIKESIRLHPQYATALELLGNIYYNQDSLSQAALLLTRANEYSPNTESISRSLKKAVLMNQADSLRKAGWSVPTTWQQ